MRLTHADLRLFDAGDRSVIRDSICSDCVEMHQIRAAAYRLRAHDPHTGRTRTKRNRRYTESIKSELR